MRFSRLLPYLLAAGALQAASSISMPILFIANRGQAPARVRFMAKGSGLTAFFTADEIALRSGGHGFRMRFEGANRDARIMGRGLQPGHVNFMVGAESGWQSEVPAYSAVEYRGLYPGIDMVYGGKGRQFKSEFRLRAGADPSRIRVRYLDAGEPGLDQGDLVVPLEDDAIREEAPVAYQETGGSRVPVASRFVIYPEGTVGFAIGAYDRSKTLIIDPTLCYSTLLGGSSTDAAMAVAVDATGASYVAGYTASYDFPVAGAEQAFDAGGNDVFIAKIAAAGNALVYATYLGGRADDRANGIAVDSSGAVYVSGWTTSADFPVRNAFQSRLGGAKNAFVAKLSASGNSLIYSTYFGGSGSDAGNGIAVDASGNAYIAGDTTSANLPANGFQRTNHGSQDAFAAKLGQSGGLVYCTYLGGSDNDHGAAIAVDGTGAAYVTGSTFSYDFPIANAYQGHNAGGQDAFAAELSANGGTLAYSTYLGGSGGGIGYPETGQAIAVDAQGNAYVTGTASSANFPVLHPLQSVLHGWTDAFVAEFNAAGGLAYSTFLGGVGVDFGNAIAVDGAGKIYVAGYTYSTDFPVVNAIQGRNLGDYDGFWAVINPGGGSLFLSDYFGGSGSDAITSLALDGAGNVYLAGWTLSNNFPLKNAYQSINGGGYSGFVAKVAVSPLPSPVSVTPSSGSGTSQTFTFTLSDPNGYQSVSVVQIAIDSQLAAATSCYLWIAPSSRSLYLANDAGIAWLGPVSFGSAGVLRNSQCSIDPSGVSSTGSGTILTLGVPVSFQTGFTGAKNIYLDAFESASVESGWQQKGTWIVPAAGPPAAISVTPSSGSGMSQTFTFAFSDPNGYQSLTVVEILIHSQISPAAGCYLWIAPSSQLLYLDNDAGTAWMGPVSFGSTGALHNSQCSVDPSGLSSTGSGTNLTLAVPVSFQSGFTGAKNIYMYAFDSVSGDSGWQQKGIWSVPATGPPAVASVAPSSGTGTSQTFTFAFSDPNGYQSLSVVEVAINSQLAAAAGCYLWIAPSSRSLYLANDAGTVWIGPVSFGSTGALHNSQCSIDPSGVWSTGSGTNLTLAVPVTFQSGFTGVKNMYLDAFDSTSAESGWQLKGTWTP